MKAYWVKWRARGGEQATSKIECMHLAVHQSGALLVYMTDDIMADADRIYAPDSWQEIWIDKPSS